MLHANWLKLKLNESISDLTKKEKNTAELL